MQATVELNTVTTKYADTQIQTDLVYYVTLPDQLQHISEQLETNHKDLNHCMEWIGECEKMMLVAMKAIDQQRQDLQELQKANHEHSYQELQHLRISLMQDIQFQLKLLAEAVEQNRISHQEQQEACRPPWECLPYQHHTRSHQQYWQQCMHQDQFWRSVRECEEQEIAKQRQLHRLDESMPELEE